MGDAAASCVQTGCGRGVPVSNRCCLSEVRTAPTESTIDEIPLPNREDSLVTATA
jgi:hypothetical protein